MQVTRDSEVFRVNERIPVLPLRDVVIFPYMIVPLLVGRQPSLRALEKAMESDKLVLALAQRGADVSEPRGRDLYRIGTLCRVLQLLRLPDGNMRALVEGLARMRVQRFERSRGFFEVAAVPLDETAEPNQETEALVRTVRAQFDEYVRQHRRIPNEILLSVNAIENPRRLVHVVGTHLASRMPVKQELLETVDLAVQLRMLSRHLREELEILGIERKIEGEVRVQVQRNQREFYLNEQLKAIRKELGDPGDFGAEADELQEQVKKAGMPPEVEKKAQREVERLRKMAPLSPEATVSRTYVEWLVALPWSVRTTDRLDLADARRILDEDHFGLEKAKERVLEFLAVLQLVGRLKGPILCFAGPPGVGKTSLARSIARALDRKFVRMSLGGVRDEAEIRGHRRTYIGSLPGRILQRMRSAGARNPVFLLDEVDKLGSDYRGDPAAALLEVLDPEQNCRFNDHYLEVDFDLSEALFIATANVTHTVPPALLDRMEVIRLPGYLEPEKIGIAQGFLVPRNLESHGLSKDLVRFTDGAVQTAIRGYTREAGVRSLERELASVCRKLAREEAARRGSGGTGEPAAREVRPADVRRLLGVRRFPEREILPADRVGVAAGLAWTETGGEVMLVEAAALPGRGQLTLTGKLGEVMRESGQAALSHARARATALGLPNDFHERIDLHVHIPEGAIPKDGPSAGITMAVAIVSALAGVPVRRDAAFTGEITLSGDVLPIGGLNEKIVAARRGGYRTVILPEENRKDLAELAPSLKRGVRFQLVRTMDEVLRAGLVAEFPFTPAPAPAAAAAPRPDAPQPPAGLAH